MSSRGSYRRHAPEFKIQLCQDIRSGAIGRHDAARKHTLSTNLIQLWLTQYDRGELSTEEAEASTISEYEARIAALERKVGQLTMELDLVKKTPHLRLVSDNENFSIVTGPRPAPSDGGQVIELPRSTFHYRPTVADESLDDAKLVDLIGHIQDELPGYGYRRVTHELRRRSHLVKRLAAPPIGRVPRGNDAVDRGRCTCTV